MALNNQGIQSAFADLGGMISAFGAAGQAQASAKGFRYDAIGAGLQGQATQAQAVGQENADRYAAAGDLITASSYRTAADASRQSAETYRQAAGLQGEAETAVGLDIGIVQGSTEIQKAQLQRSIYATEGSQTAAVAASGFQNSGSAYYLHASSAAQGALALGLVQQQGALNVDALKQQQMAFEVQKQNDLGLAGQAEFSAKEQELGAQSADEAAAAANQAEKDTENIAGIAKQQNDVAIQKDLEMARASKQSSKLDMVGGFVKGIAGIASLFAA